MTLDETEDRVGRAYAATFRDELAALTTDLPSSSSASGWSAVWSTAWSQIVTDLAVATGRVEADPRARLRATATVVVPLLVLLAITSVALALLAHGLMEGHEFEHGFDHAIVRGAPLEPGGAGPD
ncbi:hypothetical protein TOK_5423 [Pseudonocardia sp. N23]|nr:hypothetical protein TOK_5423 [Pseudonocardia sp. N23]